MSTGPRYTVITYIMGDYEQVHEIKERSERATYLLITDNPNLKSTTWTVMRDDSLNGRAWDKVMIVRWFPWLYAEDDIVITIDGSLGINSNLDELVDAFIAGGHELGIVIHPHRNTIAAELEVWRGLRDYRGTPAQLQVLHNAGYDCDTYRGLYQTGFMIRRYTKDIMRWNRTIEQISLKCGYTGYYLHDRLDQTIASAMLNLFHSDMSVLWFSERLLESKFITWYGHGTNDIVHQTNLIEPYAFNRPVEVYI
jgi:hypothetical protein